MAFNRRRFRRFRIGNGAELLESRRLLDASGLLPAMVEPAEQHPTGQPRIVGGTEVESDEPWMVALQDRGGNHFCGGSLIAPDVVVTAAHCTEGETRTSMQIELGLHALGDQGEVHQIEQIVVHPDYDTLTLDSDIALLLLSTPSTRDTIRLATLLDAELEVPGRLVTAMGWGTTQTAVPSDPIREVTLPIVDREVANRPNAYDGQITEQMLAAGDTGRDTCQGDSGGPLFTQDADGNDVLIGITSWGQGCGDPGYPGIYTRVSRFADWALSELLVTSAGWVDFTEDGYSAKGSANIRLSDVDLTGQGAASVVVTSSAGDTETVELLESTSGRFSGNVNFASTGIVTVGDGVIDVDEGGTIEVTYLDEDDGTGTAATVSGTASIIADDHGDRPETATPIGIDEPIEGELQFEADIDTFSFEATAGTQYRLAVTLNSLDDSVLDLVDGEDLVIANNDDWQDELASVIVWTAEESETLYAKVRGYNNAQGTYSLTITEADGTLVDDDHGNDASTSTPIELGSSTPGSIGNNDTDWFQLTVDPDSRLELQVDLGTLDDSVLELRDSEGVLITEDDDGGSGLGSRIVYSFAEGGTYYAVVEPYFNEQGSYTLTVNDAGPAPEDLHGDTPETATPLAFEESIDGYIDGADTDWFRIEVGPNSSFSIDVTLGTLNDSVLELRDESGNFLTENDDTPNDLASSIAWTSQTGGTFYAVVRSYSGDEAGSYSVAVTFAELKVDDHGNGPDDATPISIRSVTDGTIDTDDSDWFRFSADAGTIIDIEIVLSTLFDSVLEIRDDTGELVERDDDGGVELGSAITFEVPVSGTYYAVVLPFDTEVGDYSLNLTTNDDHGNSHESATLLLLDEAVEGVFDEAEDRDVFELDMVGGRAYRFELEGESATLPDEAQPDIQLYAPDGTSLLDTVSTEINDGTYRASFSWIAPDDGNYFLALSDTVPSSYTLSASVVYGDSNLDGVFSSADIVDIFKAGEYDDDLVGNSTWTTGDWSGDGEFDSTDLVLAFTLGTYQE